MTKITLTQKSTGGKLVLTYGVRFSADQITRAVAGQLARMGVTDIAGALADMTAEVEVS